MKSTVHTENDRERVISKITSAKLPLSVEWKRWVEKRSNPQNSLVHVWFGVISTKHAENTGKFYHADMWKVHLKEMFGYWIEVEMPDGKIRRELKSTADYDVAEMAKFMDNVDHYAGGELNIFLPMPSVPDEV
jgi:hypothetical protein